MMRIDLAFERPLTVDARHRLLIAIGALAKTRRIRFPRGDHGATIFGEALGVKTVLEALAQVEITPSSATTSLDEESAAAADDAPESKAERVKAIGR